MDDQTLLAEQQQHPYFPRDAAIPHYVPNSTALPVILGAFGALVGAFALGSVALARRHNPALKKGDQLAVGWFALCACGPADNTYLPADPSVR